MQHQSLLRAPRTQPSHLSSVFSTRAPQSSALSFLKPRPTGLSQAQLRAIVLEQLG
jgi:hypothetical protein